MLRPVDRRKKPNARKGNSLSEWLNQIQQDSWQLELVISGVVIFLLLGAYEPLMDLIDSVERRSVAFNHITDVILIVGLGMLLYAMSFVTLGFLAHLIFRGFWIGAIGLRSVSGDFDFETLRFSPRYEGWLRNRLGSFDQFIEKLETRSSIAFSLAFLLFFVVISIALYFTFVITFTSILSSLGNLFEPATTGRRLFIILTAALNIILLLGALTYLVDFFTLGALKRSKRLGKIYYPVYRFMGWVTLASLYRPFYYNLIDHPLGRLLAKLMLPVLLISFTVGGIQIGRSTYTPEYQATAFTIKANNYLTYDGDLETTAPSLATYTPETDYLEVFVPLVGREVIRTLRQRFPELRTTTKRTFGVQDVIDVYRDDVSSDSLLQAHRFIHHIYLNDSLLVDAPWKFYKHPRRDQFGLVYGLPIYDLPRGEHCLRFERLQRIERDSLGWEDQGTLCVLR